MKISVIIRCYNEEKHIGRLLSGIMKQSIKCHEIIIVDSGSSDATVTIASQFPTKLIEIDKSEFTFGFSLNKGCESSTGDILVLASAHVYPVYEDWLAELVAPFVDKNVALTYGKQIGNEITKYSEHQLFAQWFPDNSVANQQHPFCNNANSAVRRTMWETLPYDESLTGLEDLDWAKRAMNLGYKISYVADAPIVHVHEETPKRIYNRYRREAMALKRIFPEQRMTTWDFLRLFSTNSALDCYHAFYDKKLLRNLVDIPMFRLMQFFGAYRGFRDSRIPIEQVRRTFYYPRSIGESQPTERERSSPKINYTTPTIYEHRTVR